MSLTLREHGIETVHDQVVALVAQRWAKAFVCKVTVRAGLDQNPWAEPEQLCDIVGWYVCSGGNTMEWMAEVETEDSLLDARVVDKWKRAITRGIPFYLVVPQGLKDLALELSKHESIPVSCVYEFMFINGVCHLL
ncbi:MAG TPA: hypothetical protein VFM24_03330 [Nitrospira sp.]|nr:hypothetical protein [Nitrospira sp.]